ncbi:MAG: protein kinase [Melioribacteraceae bacterium]|nr:protein kinase [Melioribacteraceae bacterium]
MIGQTISHYKILEKLGGGGMGVVYKAQDLKLDRQVALKFLPPTFSFDEEAKQRFIHEAKASSSLEHNNICTIHEIGETEDGQLFITMACYEGETLKKKIESGPINIEETIDITNQIAEGLDVAHKKGIVHRDIKPANIFITNDGLVKILDFGLAKSASRNTMTQLGSTVGTVAYMSPEQTNGEEVDHRTDIWSLGVVMYEMLTSQLPFKGEYEQAIVYSILNEEPVPPREIRKDIPKVIEKIITKTLAKKPAERYQSFDVLLVDLRTLQKGSKTVQNNSALNETNKWTILKFVGIVLSIIFIVAVILYFFPSGNKNIDSIAVLPLENISGDPKYEYFADGMTDALIGELGKISALKVTSRTSIMQYKGVHKSVIDIGNELDADVIVEGTVLNIGDQVRINTRLIDAREDKNLWNGQYESELKNILTLQSNISQKIASEIKVTITPEEKISLAQTEEVNSEAYQLYLNGRYYWNKRSPESLYKGISYFNKAIKIDSNYALAYTGLADSYHLLSTYGLLKPKDAFTKSKKAVIKALELDDKLSDAHNSMAAINYFYDWNWKEAEAEFIKAIELNPNNYLAHRWYALFLTTHNRRSEALKELNYAIAINPFYPLGYIDLGR